MVPYGVFKAPERNLLFLRHIPGMSMNPEGPRTLSRERLHCPDHLLQDHKSSRILHICTFSLFFVLINCYPGLILGSNANEVNSDILYKISFSRLNLREKIQCLSFMQNDRNCPLYLNYFREKFKLNDTSISRIKTTISRRMLQILRIFLSDWLLIKLIIIKRSLVDSFKI